MKHLIFILSFFCLCGFKKIPQNEIPGFATETISELGVGMTRQATEKILKKEWKVVLSASWNSGQTTYYQHREKREFYLLVRFNWKDISRERMKRGGPLRISSNDQEIIGPIEIRIKPSEQNCHNSE